MLFRSSEQNIYEGWHYMDRKGRVFTDRECREELEQYKRTSRKYAHLNGRPEGMRLKCMELHGKYIYGKAYCAKIARGLKRRIKEKISR